MTNKDQKSKITRRQFLGQASCAAVGSQSLVSTLLSLKLSNNAAAESLNDLDDYKALVCVFLAGGNDSYNMLVPTSASEYSLYAQARQQMALPLYGEGAILPINALETGGREFGVHPAMPEVQQLFNDGNLSFLSNVGTLVEPTTVEQYKQRAVQIPRQLFSHSDQIEQWQTSVPHTTSPTGWSGRIADVLQSTGVNNSQISMNISLGGNNIMQTGHDTSFYAITPNGSIRMVGKDDLAGRNFMRYKQISSLMDLQYNNLFQQAFVDEMRNSVESDEIFSAAYNQSLINTPFPMDQLGSNLAGVARTIQVQQALGMKRQIFFVRLGGWDHHKNLLESQNEMLPILSQSLKSFWDALGELGMQNNVTTFTASDFGRTLRSNGSGTDHGWAGNQLVMGGSVLPQRIFGQYPELLLNDGLDVETNGRLLPTTSVDEFFADLALWFGVSPSDLSTIFPNINNFYTPGSSSMPIGMFQS